jgi:3-methyladenine DNA glycosylase AlkD
MIDTVKSELRSIGTPQKAKDLAWFFKTGPGQYGEGDVFIGVMVPEQRMIAKKYRDMSLSEVIKLLHSKEHEFRLTALFILIDKYTKGDLKSKKTIFGLYLKNTKWINNWDLVDLSSHKIVGDFLLNKPRKILFKLARSKSLWERRIAIISTFPFINQGDSTTSLEIAEKLLGDKHDLIHKAVGWMLREVGKRCSPKEEIEFLNKYYKTMPRTMLRYAIERLTPEQKAFYMKR